MQSVLLVDDDVQVTWALKALLELDGFHVVSLTSPLVALETMSGQPFDTVVSDLDMPGYSGLEVLARARRLLPSAALILATERPEVKVPAGVTRIAKPIDYDALVRRMRRPVGPNALNSFLHQLSRSKREGLPRPRWPLPSPTIQEKL